MGVERRVNAAVLRFFLCLDDYVVQAMSRTEGASSFSPRGFLARRGSTLDSVGPRLDSTSHADTDCSWCKKLAPSMPAAKLAVRSQAKSLWEQNAHVKLDIGVAYSSSLRVTIDFELRYHLQQYNNLFGPADPCAYLHETMETTPPPAPAVLRAVSLDFDDTLIESEAMETRSTRLGLAGLRRAARRRSAASIPTRAPAPR